MSKMNKRVYGVLGISSVMANWNADFEGFPKATTKEQFFGSDKALKYPMKKMWEELGEKVLNIKSLRLKADKKGEINLVPRTLKERYEYIFDVEDLKKVKDTGEILKNLFIFLITLSYVLKLKHSFLITFTIYLNFLLLLVQFSNFHLQLH